jgi:hypothetical protein
MQLDFIINTYSLDSNIIGINILNHTITELDKLISNTSVNTMLYINLTTYKSKILDCIGYLTNIDYLLECKDYVVLDNINII